MKKMAMVLNILKEGKILPFLSLNQIRLIQLRRFGISILVLMKKETKSLLEAAVEAVVRHAIMMAIVIIVDIIVQVTVLVKTNNPMVQYIPYQCIHNNLSIKYLLFVCRLYLLINACFMRVYHAVTEFFCKVPVQSYIY